MAGYWSTFYHPDGALINLRDDRGNSVDFIFDQRNVEQFIRSLCERAGLPEPWTKG